MADAKFEVVWRFNGERDVPIAWFVDDLDASEFVRVQARPDFYIIRDL